MHRKFNPDKRHLALYILDECQHRLFNSEKERKLQKIGSSIISQLVDEVRSLNISICSLSQEPSSLVKPAVNNSYAKLVFHLGTGSEIDVMIKAIGLNNDQAEILYRIETGEAIVRLAGGYMEPFPVLIDEFTYPRDIDVIEFNKHQAELKDDLYARSEIVYESDKSVRKSQLEKKRICKKPKSIRPKFQNTVSSQFISVLQVWLNQRNIFLTQGGIFAKAGIKSGSTQSRLKKEAIRHELIIEHKIQIGKTFMSVWEPTQKAFNLIKVSKPCLKSKGGYLHQFSAYHIKQWFESRGYSAKLEFQLTNRKAVDLIAQNRAATLFIEIVVSSLEKEKSNVLKDFATEFMPGKLIFAVINSRVKKKLTDLIFNNPETRKHRDRIEIRLIGDFLGND